MPLTLLALGVLALLTAGYLTYGAYLARRFQLDDARATPAARRADGVDFIPTRPFALLAQHFSAIAAAGPIVGPIVACIAFGWLPCLLWIALGVILIGAVHDFSALVASVRHNAGSVADIARAHLGRPAAVALAAFIWLALLYVIVAFTDVTTSTFLGQTEDFTGLAAGFNIGGAVAAASILYLALALVMGLVQRLLAPPTWLITLIFVPATLGVIGLATRLSTLSIFSAPESLLGLDPAARPAVWYVLILLYCFAASLLPLWILQQPRGYLGGFVLYLAIAVGLVGILFGGFDIQQPALRPVADYAAFFGLSNSPGPNPPPFTALIFPFLFVTIACGACSGFHGLVCGGTTCRQLAKETHARPVAFGAMLLEGFVAVIALATVMVVAAGTDLRAYPGGPSAIYGDGLATFLTGVLGLESDQALAFARTFGRMAVATFIFDTLDVATRLGRYLLLEVVAPAPAEHADSSQTRHHAAHPSPRRIASLAAAALTAFTPLAILFLAERGSYMLFWTLFGTANQLLAALTLLGITVWLRREGRPVHFVFLPMLFVMTITLCALAIQIFVGVRDLAAGRAFISAASTAAGAAAPGGGALRLNPTVLNAAVGAALAALAVFIISRARRAATGRPLPGYPGSPSR